MTDLSNAILEIARLGDELERIKKQRDQAERMVGKLVAELNYTKEQLEQECRQSGISANREWRTITERDQARHSAKCWEECANQFFLCAGKDKTASWDQFEKAAMTYQSLKKKGEQC